MKRAARTTKRARISRTQSIRSLQRQLAHLCELERILNLQSAIIRRRVAAAAAS
jgi:hypothetical protein